MPVPDYQSLMLPLLTRLDDGEEHALKELREEISADLNLTDADRAELLPSGKQAIFDNRLGWAKTYLDKAGLLRSVRRGIYQVTERGKQVLNKRPETLSNIVLAQFPEFVAFETGTGESPVADSTRLEPTKSSASIRTIFPKSEWARSLTTPETRRAS